MYGSVTPIVLNFSLYSAGKALALLLLSYCSPIALLLPHFIGDKEGLAQLAHVWVGNSAPRTMPPPGLGGRAMCG